MQSISLVLLAFGMGFVAAIPIGPSQIEMAKRAIKGHLRAAQMVVLGSVSSDVLYGVIALFGIAPFLEIPKVLAAFHVLGAFILWILTYLTWKESRKPHDLDLEKSSLKSKRWAYLTGFTVALSNPPMILSWLVGVTLAKRFGLATPFTDTTKILFIAGGALGLGGYLSALGVLMYRVKHVIPLKAMGSIYRWLAVTLFVLSWFFVYGAVRFVLHGE
jgi:threonine/homoserine/homoserine lactone efflux protein